MLLPELRNCPGDFIVNNNSWIILKGR